MSGNDSLLLQSILDRITNIEDKVDAISTKQALIESKLEEHIKAALSAPVKSIWSKIFDGIKNYAIVGIIVIISIFELGRCSVEAADFADKIYLQSKHDTSNTLILNKSKVDDTAVRSTNKSLNAKIDAAIVKRLLWN